MTRTGIKTSGILAGILSGVICSVPAQAVASSLAAACDALETTDFSTVQDAPTQVMEADVVAATGDKPVHCRVQGYALPQVGFELHLPLSNWNGKFIFAGCGALCGSTFAAPRCYAVMRRGYACIASDGGHRSSPTAGLWAYNNLQAEVDYGFRAVHVATLAGKAITQHYYGAAPKFSYFVGGSNGGREGGMQAQRFPWNYDGMVLVNPTINNHALKIMTLLWNILAVTNKDGKPLFTDADVDLLHNAVLAKCDATDGLKDGIIDDPRTCQFDPAELLCKGAKQSRCLSQSHVVAAAKMYSGPVTSKGERLHYGIMPGSEKGMFSFNIVREYAGVGNRSGSPGANLVDSYFRYVAFKPDPGSSWNREDFDFDVDYKRLGMASSLYDASNPDLRKFKARGGKLIILQGLDDSGLQGPLDVIDYYETVEKIAGGRAQMQEFARLFLVPGLEHGVEGPGANTFDLLGHLEAWVERGEAPDMIVGAHVEKGAADIYGGTGMVESGKAKFTRPVYPYPLQARYKGKGDPNDYRSFAPVESAPQ